MSRESPISACPHCAAPTAWSLSGDAVFCPACRRWFRRAGAGIESMAAGWPLRPWLPLADGGAHAR